MCVVVGYFVGYQHSNPLTSQGKTQTGLHRKARTPEMYLQVSSKQEFALHLPVTDRVNSNRETRWDCDLCRSTSHCTLSQPRSVTFALPLCGSLLYVCLSSRGMLAVRARNCHQLFRLRRSPTQIGLSLWARGEIQGGLLVPTTAVSCSPAWRSSRQSNDISTTNTNANVGNLIVRGNASVREKVARAFRSLIRALEMLLRAVRISLLFSPVVVSGSVVGVSQRLGVLPEALSTTLCNWWWRFLLKVVDQSGPTFIKVNKC